MAQAEVCKSAPSKPCIWGLTGGIGSGKSLVATYLREAGITVINLDDLGRTITEQNPTLIKAISHLLNENLDSGGNLNRNRVRELIFHDPAKKAALESLLHPLIWKRFQEEVDREVQSGKTLIVCEAALLIESGHNKNFKKLLVVMADEKMRRERCKKRDGLSDELFDQILKMQTNDKLREKMATHRLINEGTETQLKNQVSALVKTLKPA